MSNKFDYILAKHEDFGGMPLTQHLKDVADAAAEEHCKACRDKDIRLDSSEIFRDNIFYRHQRNHRKRHIPPYPAAL